MKKYSLIKKVICVSFLLVINCLAWGDQYAYCSFITTKPFIKFLIPENCSIFGEDFTVENATNNKPLLCTVEWKLLLKPGASEYQFSANFPSDTKYENWNGLSVLEAEAWDKMYGRGPHDINRFFGKLVARAPVSGSPIYIGGLPVTGLPAGKLVPFTVYSAIGNRGATTWRFSTLSADDYNTLMNLSAQIRDGKIMYDHAMDKEDEIFGKNEAISMKCLFNNYGPILPNLKMQQNAHLWRPYTKNLAKQ